MVQTPCQPIPFDEFRAAVLRVYSTGRHARSTRQHVRQVLGELVRLGPVSTADLTTDLFARWIAAKGPNPNPNSVNSLLTAASAACSIAVEEGWLGRAPAWRRLRPRPGPTVRNAPPPFGDLVRLLEDLAGRRDESWEAHRLAALVWTIALTGLRRNEALRLRLEDVDLGDAPALRVDPAAQPGGRLKSAASARRVPAPEALAEFLRGWRPLAGPLWLFPGVRRVGAWTGGTARQRPLGALQEAARRAGLGRVTLHGLRHAYGTAALERWGVPLWALQRLLGHASSRTTERYLHLDGSERIAESVRRVSFRPPSA